MRFFDIVTVGFQTALSKVCDFSGVEGDPERKRFSESEKKVLRDFVKKYKEQLQDFQERHKELEKEFSDKEQFEAKKLELLSVEIDLQPALSYDMIKRVSLSFNDEEFLQPVIVHEQKEGE